MASKINPLSYKWILLLLVTLYLIFFAVFFLFIRIRKNDQIESSFLQNRPEERCLISEGEGLKLVPVSKEKEEEILKHYKILEIGQLYGERKKIFINLSQEKTCPKVNEIIFLPFYADRNETKEIEVSFIHCDNKFPIRVQGELRIGEQNYLIDFSATKRTRDFSLWRGRILKIPEEKLKQDCYPIDFSIEDNSGHFFQFRQYIEIF